MVQQVSGPSYVYLPSAGPTGVGSALGCAEAIPSGSHPLRGGMRAMGGGGDGTQCLKLA